MIAFGKHALLAAGWYGAQLRHDRFPGVLVLCYHGVRSGAWRGDEPAHAQLHIDADNFDAHCELIASACHPISLDDWRRAAGGGTPLPDRPVLMTFDDGYRSVFDLARPILKRHRIPATVFVCSEPVRAQRLFWFDAEARRTTCRLVDAGDPLAPMTIDQVRQLTAEGFDVGVHTANHVKLGAEPGDVQHQEIAECRERLRQWTGVTPSAIAYPFGKPVDDYTSESVRMARELGFEFGFTTRAGFARATEPPLERSRFLVLSAVSAAELAHRIAYTWPR